jgi:nucleotide-binding universal stress UspA family protein
VVFEKILICVDETPLSALAIEKGVALGQALGSELALVSVADAELAATAPTDVPPAEVLADERNQAARAIEAARERPELSAAVAFTPEGDAADKISETAGQWGADLIVIGSHHRTGLAHLLLGSVAEKVARTASCAVLIVRAPT